MKNYLLSILAAVAVLCTACGGDDEPAEVNATGVKLDKEMVVLEIGESTTVNATLAPENATNKNVKWAVKNTAIATVNNGVVKGVAVGETTLTVTTVDGGHTATIPVKVVTEKVPVTGIALTCPSNIKVGDSATLTVHFFPLNATNHSLSFVIDNPECVKISYQQTEDNRAMYSITGVQDGIVKIKAVSEDGGFESNVCAVMVGALPTSVTFDGTAPYEFYYWQGKVIDFKNDLKMKVEPADADFNRIEWSLSIESARDDVSDEEVKYEVKDDNITLSYAHSTNWVAAETVHATAYVDGVEIGSVSIIMQNRGMLLYTTSLKPYYDLAMQGNKMNWDNKNVTKLRYICYNKLVGTDGKYDKYQIPSSEYTLTSSDESKVKVTKNDDGISWMVERLNTTDLVAVTLTYKCGEHTQTYTLNLIP